MPPGARIDLSDLIAAFSIRKTRQNNAEFVRIWMKRPGVRRVFAARYRETCRGDGPNEKETAR